MKTKMLQCKWLVRIKRKKSKENNLKKEKVGHDEESLRTEGKLAEGKWKNTRDKNENSHVR